MGTDESKEIAEVGFRVPGKNQQNKGGFFNYRGQKRQGLRGKRDQGLRTKTSS